jgi:CHRD domain
VNARMAENIKNLGIRGQLVDELTTNLRRSEEVLPFKGSPGAFGEATISFEEGGKVACIDATIVGFDPMVVHLHRGLPGENTGGLAVLNFSSKRIAAGRFNGCGTLSQLGSDEGVETTASILSDPSGYYLHFHRAASGPNFFTSIRGQLDDVVV